MQDSRFFISFFRSVILTAAGVLASTGPMVQAQEPDTTRIVVTASRIVTSAERTASAVTVISREELEKREAVPVSELLAGTPGVHVTRSGSAGGASSVFLRGADAGHTLVMIDGVAVNDPVSTTRSFDFANLSTDNVERIEIVRGAQSVLYGSDALGGVIHIITRKGEGRPVVAIEGGYGSYSTFDSRLSLHGGGRESNYSLALGARGTEGVSAAKVPGGDADGQDQLLASMKLGRMMLGVESGLTARYSRSAFSSDRMGGPGGDDPDFTGTEESVLTGLEIKPADPGLWEPVLSFSFFHQARSSHDGADPSVAGSEDQDWKYRGSRGELTFLNRFYASDSHTFVAGWAHRLEAGSSREQGASAAAVENVSPLRLNAAFIEHSYDGETLFTSAGVRRDVYHDGVGAATTLRIAPGVRLGTDTTVRAGFGTGFKAPSLYQLHSMYGNSTLEPEQSVSWDAGVERRFGARLSGRLGVYRNEFRNLIDYDFTSSRFVNQGRARTEGAELELDAAITRGWKAGLAYTYTWARDLDDGNRLLRRPAHQLKADAGYRAGAAGFGANLRYVGTRPDLDPVTFQRTWMPAHVVVGIDASYELSTMTRIFGRLDNVFGADYEEVAGFSTPGRSLYVGIRQTL